MLWYNKIVNFNKKGGDVFMTVGLLISILLCGLNYIGEISISWFMCFLPTMIECGLYVVLILYMIVVQIILWFKWK